MGEIKKKKKGIVRYEIVLALVIIAVILLTQTIGTTSVIDPSSVDENGHPITDKTFEDLAEPGTRFGIITGNELGIQLMKYYPDGEFQMFNTFPDVYTAVNEGIVDAATAFIDQRDEIESANPNVAFMDSSAVHLMNL